MHLICIKKILLNITRFVAPLLGVTILSVAAVADTPYEKPVGLINAGDAVGMVDLAPHDLSGSMGDYNLRARRIELAPGGGIHPHPHKGKPGIVTVTKGSVYEYRGDDKRELKVGDQWFEDSDTVHWFRNPSKTEAAEIWVVDIVPKK
jgi:quercetin dioxygenase-like cupin family protein